MTAQPADREYASIPRVPDAGREKTLLTLNCDKCGWLYVCDHFLVAAFTCSGEAELSERVGANAEYG